MEPSGGLVKRRDQPATNGAGAATNGAQPLLPGHLADPPDLADPQAPRRAAAQAAIDALRDRFGARAVLRGRGL